MAKDQNESVPDWLIPDKAYDVLKWVGLLLLPACAWFVGTVGPVWGVGERRWHRVDAQRRRRPHRRRDWRVRSQS